MKKQLLLLTMVFLLLTPVTFSIGVIPGRTTINFQPNLEREIEFTILNNENKDFKAAIYVRGDLSEYITLEKTEIEFEKNEKSKKASYTIRLPESFKEPGLHKADIIIREIKSTNQEEPIAIGTMVGVISQIYVYVPYPGKYLIAKLDIVKGKVEKYAQFYIPLINFGKENINNAKAEITIKEPSGKIVDKIYTNEKPVPAQGRAELSAKLDITNYGAGIYMAIATVTYDGKTTTAENVFFIKDFFLIPLDISVRDFKLGEIAEFNILVENIGNIDIKDAFSIMLLDDLDGNSVANIKSESIDIKAKEKKEMHAYWETKNIKEGEYLGKLILGYESKTDEKQIKTTVTKNSIKTEILGITGHAIKEEKPAPEGNQVWILLVILLVIVNIAWFIFYFIKKK